MESLIDIAIKHLASNDPVDIQRGTGYAVIALLKELKENANTTLNSKRKPEEGDTMMMLCYTCKEDTLNTLKKDTMQPYGLIWRCSKCKRTH